MLHFGQQTCIKKELGVFNLHCTICLNFLSVVKGLQIFEFIISDYVLYSVMGCHTIETSLYVQTSPVYLQETADLVENYIFSTPPPPKSTGCQSQRNNMTHAQCLNHLNPDKTLNQVNLMARLEAQGTVSNPEEKQRWPSRSI